MTISQMLRRSSWEYMKITLGEVVDDNEEAIKEAYRLLGRLGEYQDRGEDVMQALMVWVLDELEQKIDELTWNEEARKDFREFASDWIERRRAAIEHDKERQRAGRVA